MPTSTSFTGDLTFGHLLAAAGIDPRDVVVIRHTYTADGLQNDADLTEENLLAYTRAQGVGPNHKLGKIPRPLWLCFMADGKRRSRYLVAYENHGELVAERTEDLRYFDLRPSAALSALADRLVVEWSRDAVNWAKTGESASIFPVVEIADPEVVPFPGFDNVLLSYGELQAVVADSRYAAWRTALGSVQGIYLIADRLDGKLYVGKADGAERLLGRWSQYAKDAHGGNVALKELALDADHRRHLQFSILRVFGPSVPSTELDAAEAAYKRALLTRQFGLNRN
ncbi:GIY-YIG nuclease family protein [Nocardioides sp. Bht2]|uniref:GIY-YIG nuclease family protein n=1 Tax=Nocardioides sp. Bht2 TaxID=3392297 RepID=UPI0039B37CEC